MGRGEINNYGPNDGITSKFLCWKPVPSLKAWGSGTFRTWLFPECGTFIDGICGSRKAWITQPFLLSSLREARTCHHEEEHCHILNLDLGYPKLQNCKIKKHYMLRPHKFMEVNSSLKFLPQRTTLNGEITQTKRVSIKMEIKELSWNSLVLL